MDNKLNKAQMAFMEALLALMAEKPYGQISISELSDLAQYDRRTYYRYFDSKDDILSLYCSSLLEEMAEEMKSKGPLTPRSGFLTFFEFWAHHQEFLSLMERQNLLFFLGEILGNLLYEHVGLKMHDDLPERLEMVPEFSLFAYYFTLGGLWQALALWVRNGKKQTPEQLTAYILDSFTEMQKFIQNDAT